MVTTEEINAGMVVSDTGTEMKPAKKSFSLLKLLIYPY